MKTIWAVNPNYERRDREALLNNIANTAKFKAEAEARMAAFDKLPRAAREAVHEFGCSAAWALRADASHAALPTRSLRFALRLSAA